MENPSAERTLSPSETFLWLIDQECRINFVMHARVRGTVAEDALRRGLRAVQARHPLLRVRIEKDRWRRVSFKTSGVPELPLRVVERAVPGWIEEAEQELHEPLPVQKGPLAIAARRSLWDCVERGEPFVYGVQHRDLCRLNALLGTGSLGRRAVACVAESWAFGGLTLSNIGRVPLEDLHGPFSIEDLGFAASLSCLSPLAAFAATIDRRSTWNFVGMEPLLTKAHTEDIADRAVKILSKAVDGEGCAAPRLRSGKERSTFQE